MWSLPNRQKLETAGTVLRLVGNEKAKYALRGRVLAADEMSLLIDQSPGAFSKTATSKKPSKAAGAVGFGTAVRSLKSDRFRRRCCTGRDMQPSCGRYSMLARVVDFLSCRSRTDSV